MGLDPRRVDALTLGEMRMLVREWNDLHRSEDAPPPAPSDEEYFAMLDLTADG